MNAFIFFQQARLCLLSFSLLLAVPLFAAQYEETATGEYLFARGMVHTISSQDQTLTIQPNKGPHVKIMVNAKTELAGFGKLEDLQKRQEVKIWYHPDKNGNTGLKILKLPDQGC
jgi:hypothetical protein